jgi:peptidoglycan/xylan/chitin deacetylase (PgdA/CDA1 family)
MMRRIVKTILASILYYTGIIRLIWAIRMLIQGGHQTVILTYHRVTPNEADDGTCGSLQGIVVEPDTFAQHLQHLRKRFDVISLDDLVLRLRQRSKAPGRTAVITFDDGWRDNYTYAYPRLKEIDLPATVFIAVGYIGTRRLFWPEQIIACINSLRKTREFQGSERLSRDFPRVKASIEETLRAEPAQLQDSLYSLIEFIKRLPADDRDKIMGVLMDSSGSIDCGRVMLDWDELSEMKSHFTVGSHGIEHEILTQVDSETLHKEVFESKRLIHERLGVNVSSFAYPNGDFDELCKGAVQEAGYECAVSTVTGSVGMQADLMALRRISISENVSKGLWCGFSKSLFEWHLLGVRLF